MRFLFVDRILELIEGKSVRGLKHLSADDPFVYENEAQRFCFMPSLIGETLGQLAAWNVMQATAFKLRPVAGVVASAKLHREAYLGETLMLEAEIESIDEAAVQYKARAFVKEELVFSVDGALGPLLPMSDFIEPALALRQFQAINRPGTWLETEQDLAELVGEQALRPNLQYKLAFDRLLGFDKAVSLRAEKRINRAAPYFADHFPNKPVLPMTVLLEAKCNLARFFVEHSFNERYLITELRKIKMNEFIQPGDRIVTELKLKEQQEKNLILSYRTELEGKRVCVLEVVMTKVGS